jgi:hypothetical protein
VESLIRGLSRVIGGSILHDEAVAYTHREDLMLLLQGLNERDHTLDVRG